VMSMRRKDREITDRVEIDDIIRRCRVCRIAMVDDGEPYVIPMSFGYDGESVYLHSAPEGRKLEVLRKSPRICVEFDILNEVRGSDQACEWGMAYESVIAMGAVEILEDAEEKRQGLDCVMAQYTEGDWDFPDDAISRTVVIRVRIDSISGKART
jgi:hypothetical protein